MDFIRGGGAETQGGGGSGEGQVGALVQEGGGECSGS